MITRLRGRGHPAVRATHANTFEFTTDEHIGAGATCVVAVAASSDVVPLAGLVRLELTAGRHTVTAHALANPRWVPGGPAVVRRSAVRLPNTFATDADLAASDLPRDLVAALTDPSTVVELIVTPMPPPPSLVLLWAATCCRHLDRASTSAAPAAPAGASTAPVRSVDVPPHRCRLSIEAAAATVVVAEDDGAARLLATHGVRAVRAGRSVAPAGQSVDRVGQSVDRVGQSVHQVGRPASRVGRSVAPAGQPVDPAGRVLVVSTADLPGRSVVGLLSQPDTPIEVVGLPGPLAVAAASSSRAPLVVATDGHDAIRLLRSTPPDHRLVVRTPATAMDRLIRAAQPRSIVVARTPYELYERPQRFHDSLTLTGDLLCCFEPGTTSPGLGPSETRLAETLLAASVPTKTVARAIAELTGRPRRDVYQSLLTLAATRPTDP